MNYASGNEKLKRFHTLIEKRGEHTSNLTRAERDEYDMLCAWYNDTQHAC